MIRLLPVLMLLTLPFCLSAQTAETVPGELLVLLHPERTPQGLVQAFAKVQGQQTKLQAKRKLAPNMNIWQLSFDQNALTPDVLIRALKAHSDVAIAQVNHKTKSRLVPNDPQFPAQWQYVNAGGPGAVADADIDADEAWDITTGGTTALGHDIVVAVVDDGIELAHPDFAGNLWVNSQEIPNNNIDDDNNGYVDDYRGWNSYDNNDNVEHSQFEDHGTPVAGIIGAKGNNGIGVTGVNWDVKIMVVKGGGNEAEAVAAYAYILALRKRWNASNGAEGALVVSSNSSWGTDFGQAANAPLWCAMYDSLGHAGVLSVGATANDNVNVDVSGDLPSTCPSKYLIAVTNIKKNDQKETFAGFGSISIDMGAPGEDAFTMAKGSTYDAFGGTSGATPHVAGAIGLLYSAPCNKLAQTALDNPSAAAISVRNFIFDGGDANSSLANITVHENRLNLKGSLDELTANCLTISAEEIASTQNGTQWSHYPNPAQEIIRIRMDNASGNLKSLQVTDVLGRTTLLPLSGSEGNYTAELSNFESGWYPIQPMDAKGQAVGLAKKMVVQ